LLRPIGIFDSGIGGLTVARSTCDLLPNESILYYGDTAHLPYGEKSPELIRRYSTRIAKHLVSSGCKAIVVACNSASSNALDQIKSVVGDSIPVIDMVHPVVEKVTSDKNSLRVGLIGTRATISSGLYSRAFENMSGGEIELLNRATPLLASAIEEGFFNGTIPKAVLEAYLEDGFFDSVDSIILGCTHYPLVTNDLKKLLPQCVKIIDSPTIVATKLRDRLIELGIEADVNLDSSHKISNRFQVSDLTENFKKGSQQFFGSGIDLEEVILG
jgi:glutamate racemase